METPVESCHSCTLYLFVGQTMDTVLLDHPHAPIVLITFANFAFVVVDAAAQKLELGGVSSGQIVTMRMVRILSTCSSGLTCSSSLCLRAWAG